MSERHADETPRGSRILVATDFSEASARARDYAVALAARGDTLVVLHAHVLPLPDFPEPPYVPDWMPSGPSVLGAARERLDAFAAPARSAGLKVETVLEEGLAVEVILRVSATAQSDLIVMGTGRRGTGSEWIMGSTAEGVVRRADVPVLTVSAAAPQPAQGIRGILCATDFAGTATLDLARRWARRCGSPLSVLHVVEDPHATDPQRRSAEARLAATLKEDEAAWPADAAVRCGHAAREILAAAAEAPVDVIVMGLREQGRWPAELPHVGSTASAVMRQASCAVLTVRGPKVRPAARAARASAAR